VTAFEEIMVEIDPTTTGMEFVASAALGGIIGLAVKKVAKTVAVIIGIQLVLFRYLESYGIVMVDWDRLTAGLYDAQQRVQEDTHWIEPIVSTLSVGVGFSSGFMLGYYRG
jgi:uncharacterized membrane protein (Fun14 family)